MSDTHHHNKKRFFDGRNGRGFMGHAPAWFRRLLSRRTKRQQNSEVRDTGEVNTPNKRTADWNWW